MGGYCLESGCWWRYDFDENMRSRVRPKVFGRDDLSIDLLELLAMTVTAWAFTVQAATPPNYPEARILKRGDSDANDGLSRNAQWVVFPGKTRQRGR